MRLTFDQGTLAIREPDDRSVPYAEWDGRTGVYRAPAYRYGEVIADLEADGVVFTDAVMDPIPTPPLDANVDLRQYQREALERWLTDRRGVVVLPTGAGKTYVGMAAVDAVDAAAFVVVPTLDLVDQWKRELTRFDVPVGEYTGREKQTEAITVSTYDSAYTHADRLGNRFPMLVFDEVHHLAAEGYREIAKAFASPARLGLTATYERQDDRHRVLSDLLGGKVYEVETEELAGEYLAEFTTERIGVELTPEERSAYDTHIETWRDYIRESDIQFRGPEDFREVVLRSGSDPEAWRAVRARNEARRIAYSSEAKLDALATLLERHRGDRVIVFTRHNDLVYEVADRFFVPAITHATPAEERTRILDRFRADEYSAIVSSQVLDEGIDVPDANVGVIMSGTGSRREYRQRLGRLLRPSGGVARLYEVVSTGTGEVRTAARRSG